MAIDGVAKQAEFCYFWNEFDWEPARIKGIRHEWYYAIINKAGDHGLRCTLLVSEHRVNTEEVDGIRCGGWSWHAGSHLVCGNLFTFRA